VPFSFADMSAEPDLASTEEGQAQLIADRTQTAHLTHLELQKLQANLLERIRRERVTVEKLRGALANLTRPTLIYRCAFDVNKLVYIQ